MPPEHANVDRAISRLRERHWFRPARADGFFDRLLADERSRTRRAALLLGIPALIVCAAATYSTTRHIHSVDVEIEMELDGRELPPGSARAVVRDGRFLPLKVRVPGHGTVELNIQVPEGTDPAKLSGMRIRTKLTKER